ncbi:Uma2 family endonuclease [Leptolyngbyaceae cyanobacterium CCMR0082]|uniref:Uma2 family endonuclease n=1 Tax=Adonisia turfae CCMR0082 TaxID=2304604 RepID=A0A6M0SAD2_9CYAN|nr:Uma2 family endonuclease [Adonisia turfae]NEZ65449.1 Uma2 family endonuclease [Adonisia turfae CCMR0082]
MVATSTKLSIRWEKLPKHYVLPDDPVDNISQPFIAAALSESLSIAGRISETALITTNYGLCATVNDKTVVKAPDWAFIPHITVPRADIERSYTPYLEGDPPTVVMEFLSATEGGEYSIKATYPPGKWFYYESILKVPYYIIFEPTNGSLEVYRLDDANGYQLQMPDNQNGYLIENMGLSLGVWEGIRENRSGYWLRWWDTQGQLLLWGSELSAQERQRAEQAEQTRNAAVLKLLSMGLTTQQVAEALTLPEKAVISIQASD